MERAYERAKCLFLSQTFQRAGQAELAVAIGMFESIDELTTKDDAERFDRQKETIPRADPSSVIGRETAGRDHAVNVRMVHQVLAPGVKHAEETDLTAQAFRIGGELQQSRCTGVEQQPVKQSLVVEHQVSQPPRNSEDHMHVGNR